uniref:VWFD domain-containing protein n=1 Tax=Globisporangium ultimum (strain ATCC 200006 / CBS 805.95 / DAOM BR144) TaxID=431595 RepID=K3WVC4_GLOUD
MVRVATMLLGLASLTVGSSSAVPSAFDALPSFEIPAFDYPTLTEGANPHRLLDELQANGIVALRNVPNYANVRAQYLQKAAECAVLAADSVEASFLSTKQFQDGTTRYTISTNAGQELAGSAANTQETCPGYQELYQEFSQLIEHAVNTFGSTLDATSFTASDGTQTITSRKLVSEAVRLDHFHAYQSTAKTEDATQHRELEFSLPLHEDHGLFIAMSAPKFFDVQATGGRKLVERQLAADKSGLVIQTAAGTRVRPVLNEDEVVIMMGTGASRWLKTSHTLPAVMHGMKMPESMTNEGRSLRAWFGKMTLLPSYQRMLQNQDVMFDAHVNSTTRYLLQQKDADSDVKAIGCATGRHLQASATSCINKACKPKSGSKTSVERCNTICNRNHGPDEATECASQCKCSKGGDGQVCWMLCVLSLPTKTCAKANQVCGGSGKPEVVCNAPKKSTKSTKYYNAFEETVITVQEEDSFNDGGNESYDSYESYDTYN